MTESVREGRLARALAVTRSGRTADARRDLLGALELYREARNLLSGLEPTPLLANLLRWEGSVVRDQGKIEQADELYLESLRVAEASGSLSAQAAAVNCRGVIAQRRGDMAAAEELYARASVLASIAGEIRLAAMIEQNLGVLSNIEGDLGRAEARHRNALRAFEETGDLEAASWVYNNLGMLLNDVGAPMRAERAFRRGLAIVRARGDRPLEGILLTNYAECLIALERFDEAAEALDDGFTIACEGEELARAGEALMFRGVLERERGNFAEATRRFREALDVATSVDDGLLIAEVQRERGEMHRRLDDVAAAASDWTEALKSFERVGASRDADVIRERLADLASRAPVGRADASSGPRLIDA